MPDINKTIKNTYDEDILLAMAEAAGLPDFKNNRYNPNLEYGDFLAKTGIDFARRIKDEVNAGKIATTVLQKATTYAMNPLPGMVINPTMPFLGPLARPEAGRNLNTLDGTMGLDYESFTQVGNKHSEEVYKQTGIGIFGNLIEQSPRQAGPSGPNKNFQKRAPLTERVESAISDVIKSQTAKLQSKFSINFGRGEDEMYADVEMKDVNSGIQYIGKYGIDSDKRWSNRQNKSIGGDPVQSLIGSSDISILNPVKKRLTGLGDVKQRWAPKGEFPKGWKDNDQLYDVGNPSTLDKFNDGNDSPWQKTMPFIITDLRRPDSPIFFKAFVSDITERYNTSWQKFDVFARPEAYYRWKSCDRQFNVKLSVYAFAAPELNVIYKKLNFLTQLQYATYHSDGRMNEPPLCTMRLGDLIKSSKSSNSIAIFSRGSNGLPGIIDGLDISYPNNNWEFENGSKVPKSFEITLTFKVIHDEPVTADSNFYNVQRFGGVGSSRGFKKMFNMRTI